MTTLIETGCFYKDHLPVNYEIHYLTICDLTDILNLQQTVLASLTNQELFQPDPPDFISDLLEKKGKGISIGIFLDLKLIGYATIAYPDIPFNLGKDVSLPEKELTAVAHFETAFVHPDYQGCGLHMKLHEKRLNALNHTEYFHICTTVSPFNYPSLSNCLKIGLNITQLVAKYSGKQRYILHRDLRRTVVFDDSNSVWLLNTDFEAQHELILKGYIGYRLQKVSKESFRVLFGIPTTTKLD